MLYFYADNLFTMAAPVIPAQPAITSKISACVCVFNTKK